MCQKQIEPTKKNCRDSLFSTEILDYGQFWRCLSNLRISQVRSLATVLWFVNFLLENLIYFVVAIAVLVIAASLFPNKSCAALVKLGMPSCFVLILDVTPRERKVKNVYCVPINNIRGKD